MITVGMNYSVIPGKDEQFTSVFAKVLETMNGSTGHEKTHLYRDVFQEHEYLIVSEWSDTAAFDAFIASDAFRSVTNWGKEKILSSRPTHEVYGRDAGQAEPGPTASKCPAH